MSQVLPSEVQHALNLAVAKGEHRKLAHAFGQKQRKVKVLAAPQLLTAFRSGQRAKLRGMERLSPYYEMPPMDRYFFAGYDGKTWEEAIAQ